MSDVNVTDFANLPASINVGGLDASTVEAMIRHEMPVHTEFSFRVFDIDLNPVNIPGSPRDDVTGERNLFPATSVTKCSTAMDISRDVHTDMEMDFRELPGFQFHDLEHVVRPSLSYYRNGQEVLRFPMGTFMTGIADRDLSDRFPSGGLRHLTGYEFTKKVADIGWMSPWVVPAFTDPIITVQELLGADYRPFNEPGGSGVTPEITAYVAVPQPAVINDGFLGPAYITGIETFPGCPHAGPNIPRSRQYLPPSNLLTPYTISFDLTATDQLACINQQLLASVNYWPVHDYNNLGSLGAWEMPYYSDGIPQVAWEFDARATDDSGERSMRFVPIQQSFPGKDQIINRVVVIVSPPGLTPYSIKLANTSSDSLISTTNLRRTISGQPYKLDAVDSYDTALKYARLMLQQGASLAEQISWTGHIVPGLVAHNAIGVNVRSGGKPRIIGAGRDTQVVIDPAPVQVTGDPYSFLITGIAIDYATRTAQYTAQRTVLLGTPDGFIDEVTT